MTMFKKGALTADSPYSLRPIEQRVLRQRKEGCLFKGSDHERKKGNLSAAITEFDRMAAP